MPECVAPQHWTHLLSRRLAVCRPFYVWNGSCGSVAELGGRGDEEVMGNGGNGEVVYTQNWCVCIKKPSRSVGLLGLTLSLYILFSPYRVNFLLLLRFPGFHFNYFFNVHHHPNPNTFLTINVLFCVAQIFTSVLSFGVYRRLIALSMF